MLAAEPEGHHIDRRGRPSKAQKAADALVQAERQRIGALPPQQRILHARQFLRPQELQASLPGRSPQHSKDMKLALEVPSMDLLSQLMRHNGINGASLLTHSLLAAIRIATPENSSDEISKFANYYMQSDS